MAVVVGSSSSVVRSTESPLGNTMSAVVVCARMEAGDSTMLLWRSDGMMGVQGVRVRRLDENMVLVQGHGWSLGWWLWFGDGCRDECALL